METFINGSTASDAANNSLEDQYFRPLFSVGDPSLPLRRALFNKSTLQNETLPRLNQNHEFLFNDTIRSNYLANLEHQVAALSISSSSSSGYDSPGPSIQSDYHRNNLSLLYHQHQEQQGYFNGWSGVGGGKHDAVQHSDLNSGMTSLPPSAYFSPFLDYNNRVLSPCGTAGQPFYTPRARALQQKNNNYCCCGSRLSRRSYESSDSVIGNPKRNSGPGSLSSNWHSKMESLLRGHLGLTVSYNWPFDGYLEGMPDSITNLAASEEGCRLLQERLDGRDAKDVRAIVSALKDHTCNLMTGQSGSQLVQRILAVSSKEQIDEIVSSATKNGHRLFQACVHEHGSLVVLKFLEHLTTPEQITKVVEALKPAICILVNCPNGHRVVERCFGYFIEYTGCFVEEIIGFCFDVATNDKGCGLLQKILILYKGHQKERLLDEITSSSLPLSQDVYGNHVIQCILDLRIPHATTKILRQLQGFFVSLSIHKCGSYVVEKCISESNEEQQKNIITEMLSERLNALKIMKNVYGNYVLQMTLRTVKESVRQLVVNIIIEEMETLKNDPHGKMVVKAMNEKP